ncbi:MAG: methyltransferase [Candidatus Latescibacteria bacterium]|nr:methyltransferase [Candidatus Latescibacterota bacterium]
MRFKTKWNVRILWYGLIAVSFILLIISSYLHNAIFNKSPLIWRLFPVKIESIQNEIGNCYIAYHGKKWLSSHKHPSDAQLFEDGIPLKVGNSLHDDIRQKGGGRYSFWYDYVYFSASDNSNPKTNGKNYEIYGPVINSHSIYLVTKFLWLFLVIMWIATKNTINLLKRCYLLLKRCYLKLKQPKTLLIISYGLVVTAFFIPRVPIFFGNILPIIQPDTNSYFLPVNQIFDGQLPLFETRTPGYPIFLAMIFLIYPKLLPVILIQNLFTLMSSLFLLWVIQKTYPRLVFLCTLAIVAHVTMPILVGHDFSILTESLYTSILVIFVGLYILAIHRRKPWLFSLCSVVGGYAILVRPSGLFLFGCITLTFIYMIFNRYRIKNIICFVLPITVIVLLFMIYNLFTINRFAFSAMSSLTIYGITATYWETSDKFPEEVNEVISKFKDNETKPDEINLVKSSWNPIIIYKPFAEIGGRAVYTAQNSVFKLPYDFLKQSDLAKKVGLYAIRKHPLMYVKFVWTQATIFLYDPASWNSHYLPTLPLIFKSMYIIPNVDLNNYEYLYREYVEPPELRSIKITQNCEDLDITYVPTTIDILCTKINNIFFFFFGNCYFWLLVFVVLCLITVLDVLRTKLRNCDSFLLFMLVTMHLGAGLFMSACTVFSNRYTYPTKFLVYFSLALLPITHISILNRKKSFAPKDIQNNQYRQTKNSFDSALTERGMNQNKEAMTNINEFYRWNLVVFPFEKYKKILDLGCGPCLYYNELMFYSPNRYIATDYSEYYVSQMHQRFKNNPNCSAKKLDLTSSTLPDYLKNEKIDYVLCFDVLEHIDVHEKALENIHKIMTATGANFLFLRVPALPLIFGTNDKAIGHYRRYSKKELISLLKKYPFNIEKIHYHNFLGIIPWLIIGRVLKRSLAVTNTEGKIFNKIVPLLRFFEDLFPPPIGLSLYCICSLRDNDYEEGIK